MKEVYVDSISKVKKWESADGRKFNSAEECEKWEDSYHCTINMEMKNIPHVIIGVDELMPYAYSDDALLVIAPRNFDDVTVANAWIQLHYEVTGDNVYLTSKDIGNTKTIYVNCDGECYLNYEGSYKNMLAQTIKNFGKLQARIEGEISKKAKRGE